jgi:hypothetical protein
MILIKAPIGIAISRIVQSFIFIILVLRKAVNKALRPRTMPKLFIQGLLPELCLEIYSNWSLKYTGYLNISCYALAVGILPPIKVFPKKPTGGAKLDSMCVAV